jgi:Fe-S-cluster-containing dehydrogenase component/DMSO reductase anchor subunit
MTAQASFALPTPARLEKDKVRLPLVQQYLREQGRLTAVERFAQRHEADDLPPNARTYRDLIPLAKPKDGEQYGFEVDLDACTGCKACVTACHQLNGLDGDEGETWRSVGLLHGGTPAEPVQQTVTTACHHCLEPACMKGCPVGAYEKDPVTGIVKHLDDQCIGCQYCTLTCPYEVPQYSKSRGIVRKCDLCSDRLAVGEPPACVQACPNEAISVKIVSRRQMLEDAQGDAFLPGAPSPGITVPTTTYKTKRAVPRNLLPADFHRVRTAHRHTPLVFMLVLTQLSVGGFLIDLALGSMGEHRFLESVRPYQAVLALAMGLLALAVSVLHLGRPVYAFRAVLGIRTSWMSRECLSFGMFAGAAVAYAAVHAAPRLGEWLGFEVPFAPLLDAARGALGIVVAASGLFGVVSSMMLYQVTSRRWWGAARTTLKFGLTTLVLGGATTVVSLLLASAIEGSVEHAAPLVAALAQVVAATTFFKLLSDAAILLHLRDRQLGELKRTALLLVGELKLEAILRVVFAVIGIFFALVLAAQVAVVGAGTALSLAGLSWLAILVGELCERGLFFRGLSAPKMPGAVGP